MNVISQLITRHNATHRRYTEALHRRTDPVLLNLLRKDCISSSEELAYALKDFDTSDIDRRLNEQISDAEKTVNTTYSRLSKINHTIKMCEWFKFEKSPKTVNEQQRLTTELSRACSQLAELYTFRDNLCERIIFFVMMDRLATRGQQVSEVEKSAAIHFLGPERLSAGKRKRRKPRRYVAKGERQSVQVQQQKSKKVKAQKGRRAA